MLGLPKCHCERCCGLVNPPRWPCAKGPDTAHSRVTPASSPELARARPRQAPRFLCSRVSEATTYQPGFVRPGCFIRHRRTRLNGGELLCSSTALLQVALKAN